MGSNKIHYILYFSIFFFKKSCDNIDGLKKELPKLREYLLSDEKFRDIYMYTFDFAKEPNCKGLNFITAQGLWNLFFAEKYPGVQKQWDDFLNVNEFN